MKPADGRGATLATAQKLTMTVEEAAAALGVGRNLAYEMVREGRLTALRLGARRILIPRAALEAMLDTPQSPSKAQSAYARDARSAGNGSLL